MLKISEVRALHEKSSSSSMLEWALILKKISDQSKKYAKDVDQMKKLKEMETKITHEVVCYCHNEEVKACVTFRANRVLTGQDRMPLHLLARDMINKMEVIKIREAMRYFEVNQATLCVQASAYVELSSIDILNEEYQTIACHKYSPTKNESV